MCVYIYTHYIYILCSIKYVQPGGPVPGESPQAARLAGAYGHPGGATAKSPLPLLTRSKTWGFH
jgi:hypothetical protein